MGIIRVLPEKAANQIAAGEVITRPSSCVKEMLENAIDAGAKNIIVITEKAGRKLIEIRDDGRGMDEADAKLAFLRHATSKIRGVEDLNNIETLGFRGEALASIASVARVEMLTKKEGEEAGNFILVEGSKIIKQEKHAANTGTLIKIKDLFFNTPARKKFLKSDYTEESHIVDAVTAQGLSREDVSVKLIMEGKEVLNFPRGAGLKERAKAIIGKEAARGLIEIGEFSDTVKIHGCISKPEFAKNNRSGQFIFVNKRAVTSRRLNYAVYDGYGTLLMRGKYPAVFIFIDITPSLVDVNVHPAKAEVKFREENIVYNMLKKAVSSALNDADLAAVPEGYGSAGSYPRASSVTGAVNEYYASETTSLFEGQSAGAGRSAGRAQVKSVKRDFLGMTALGQVNRTYIIGEDSGNLVIIDQHAAHEKVLFEEIIKGLEENGIKAQELLIPETVEVTPSEKKIVEKKKEVFDAAGFTLELFGENEYKISAHPVIIRDKASAPFVEEIIGILRKKETADAGEALKDIAASMACRAAVKGGDELTMEEIQGLLTSYFEADAPYSCPHGRPPMVKISFEELEKMFKRKL